MTGRSCPPPFTHQPPKSKGLNLPWFGCRISADVEANGPAEITLAEAAERLGCHIETLRVRVRRHELEVRRGPHGRYYVREEALATMRPVRRPYDRREYSEAELAAGWAALEEHLVELGADREHVRSVISKLVDEPGRKGRMHRQLSVRSLALVGLAPDQIAKQLGMSERQVRRLADRFDRIERRYFYRPATARSFRGRSRDGQGTPASGG